MRASDYLRQDPVTTRTNLSLPELLYELDWHSHRVPLATLVDHLERLIVDWREIAPFVRFAPDTYCRNLVRAGPAYHALILCWKPGQRSPIHDHRGSSCGVRVLRGICTETVFDRRSDGLIFHTRTHQDPPGSCCGSQDADIHQISNLEHGQDLITLHIYSPPLLKMGQYSLTSAGRSEIAEQVEQAAERRLSPTCRAKLKIGFLHPLVVALWLDGARGACAQAACV